MTDNDDIAGVLKRSIRNLALLTTALFLLIVGVGSYFFLQNQARTNEGKRAHDAVCILRADLQERIHDSEALLTEHPEGIAGIPAATIKQSLDSQKQTVSALSAAHCTDD